MKTYRVLSMPGEGIGPEIVAEGERVLRAVAARYEIPIELVACEVGIPAEKKHGTPFPADVEKLCDEGARDGRTCILFGAVSDEPIGILRQRYDLFLNLRPAKMWRALVDASPLRAERVRELDVMVVRELVSGIYYGAARAGTDDKGRWAGQELYYHEREVHRIATAAFRVAERRKKKLTWVHKGNVVKGVFGLWGEVIDALAREHPTVAVEDILVDNMAAQLVRRPADFDVVLAENMFGDILSDLLGGVTGSIGMLPSASLNETGFGLFESIGGTAPDIAGRGVANPISTILSVAMMCRHIFQNERAAAAIEGAVEQVLDIGRTPDIASAGTPVLSTEAIGIAIAQRIT